MTAKKGRFRTQPPPLPDDDADDPPSCSAVEQALASMSEWIESNPLEALQSLGQLYDNKCRHLLQSDNLFGDVCRAVRKSSDIVVLAVALSCLRKIVTVYSEISTPCPLSDDLLAVVTEGLSRAINGKCPTAKREAGLTIQAINVSVSPGLQILNL